MPLRDISSLYYGNTTVLLVRVNMFGFVNIMDDIFGNTYLKHVNVI